MLILEIAILLLWIGFILQSRLLVYIVNKSFMIRITSYALPIFVIGLIGVISNYLIEKSFQLREDGFPLILPIILFTFTRYGIFYNVVTENFKTFSEVREDYKKFISKNPEFVVVHVNLQDDHLQGSELSEKAHVIPKRNLIAADMVITINSNRHYSLTYCLLCNTVHAYLLPIVEGEELRISSNQGSALNGNKILADKKGRFVWQQFTGKMLKQPTNSQVGDLKEIRTTRMNWVHLEEHYGDALFLHRKVNPSAHFFFTIFGKVVKRFAHLGLSKGGINKELDKKQQIIGVSILNKGEKAYPYSIFEPGKISLIEDQIGGIGFTLIFNGFGAYAYKITGLTLQDKCLEKENQKWNLNGIAVEGKNNLVSIHITEHAYWYLWNEFYPNTEIYSEN
ncbi:MAG: DUF3179 domain-containing (seleno)protein [Candidatus Kariarchaeaceae archaeon]